jgi:hypothetical protein
MAKATTPKKSARDRAVVEQQDHLVLGDQHVPISRLHLDPKNPRHDPLQSDAEIIAQLCKKEQVGALALDIAAMGQLNPLDVLGAIPMEGNPGHFISVEGNRRTCALLLLHDPSRAPTPELKQQLTKAAARASLPAQIKIHVFQNRAKAKPWIDRRHLGVQGGVGTLEWDTDQKARAAGNNTRTSATANALALSVLDRLLASKLITPDQRTQVSLTTITRYLGTPGVRALMGLGGTRELIYTHAENEVDAALRQLVIDSLEPDTDGTFKVNSRAGSSQRVAYANKLKSDGLTPSTPLPTPQPPSTTKSSAKTSTNSSTRRRSATDPSKLPTLFTSSLTVAIHDPVLLRLRQESLSLQLEDFPFSGNYLLRAFVERVIVLFLKKRSKYQPNMNDAQLAQACAAELLAIGVKGSALEIANKAAGSASNPFSLHSLGHAVHGGSIPTRKHLRAMADTWIPTLQAMLAVLEKNKP